MLYQTTLLVHSWLRWAAVLFGLLVVLVAIARWMKKDAWDGKVDRFGLIYMIVMDLQLVLGLLLFAVLSPWLRTMMANPAAVMGARLARYWTVEHGFGMIIAVVLAHVARLAVRRTSDATAKHRKAAIWFGLSLLIVLITLPWPFMAYARPMFRMG